MLVPKRGQGNPHLTIPQLITFFLHAYKHFQPLQCFIFKLFIRHLKSSCSICWGLRVPFYHEDIGNHGKWGRKWESWGSSAEGKVLHCSDMPAKIRLTKWVRGGRGNAS